MESTSSFIAAAPEWVRDFEHWWKFVVAMGVIATALCKLVVPGIRAIRKQLALLERIESLCRELETNHGSTLKDSVYRIEARLVLLETRESALLSDHTFGIFTCDAEGRNLYVNRTYCRLLNGSRADLLGFGWRNFIEDSDREAYDRDWKEAFKESREFEAPLRFRRSDGSHIQCLVRTYVLHDTDNNVTGYLGMVRLSGPPSLCYGPSDCD